MTIRNGIIFLLLLCISCVKDGNEPEQTGEPEEPETAFDTTKWLTKTGRDYPYRPEMYEDLVYSWVLKDLNEDEIIGMLGHPDKSNEGYLYYMIEQKRIVNFWPLRTKMIVIELGVDTAKNMIYIYE